MNPKHSAKSADWMTPDSVLEAVREFFGGTIELDAASDWQANERVKAESFLFDSLIVDWPVSKSIFLNPPGGRNGQESLPAAFWNKLAFQMHYGKEKYGHAIFLAFSIEAFQTCQATGFTMIDYPFCIPRKRLRFVSREPGIKNNPTHANAIIYVPGYLDERERFGEIFSRFGAVRL